MALYPMLSHPQARGGEENGRSLRILGRISAQNLAEG